MKRKLKPFEGQTHGRTAAWNGVTGTRFAAPLPSSAKGPIRAREARKAKGAPGY